MTGQGPLAGLRIIDITDDLGRFGTKLLAEFGADVCRIAGDGSSGTPIPGAAGRFGGQLDWWFDVAKTPLELSSGAGSGAALGLDTDYGRAQYCRLAEFADVIVEAKPAGYLAERGIDHADLLPTNPGLTQVSLSPFGRSGPRAGWQSSDLVAGALAGVLSLSGLPDEPLNTWGWQNYNFGGFVAAICALAGARAARRGQQGQLVDVSLHEVLTGSIENLMMQYFYDDVLPLPKLAARQGSLHWLGAYEVVPARVGNVMITPTPQSQQLIDWMVASGIEEAEPFVGMAVEDLLENLPALMSATRAFVATHDASAIWREAQDRHIAFGEVQDVGQVAANPQFAHRGLFTDISAPAADVDDSVRGPWRLVRFSDTPITTPDWPVRAPVPADAFAAGWAARTAPSEPAPAEIGPSGTAPLDGLVVVDLSWVLAGPFSTRILGDLGADVIKVQTEERATLVNRPDYPYYTVWNRSKRSVTLDLKHPDAPPIVKRLIEKADVLVENYSAGVLDRLGLGWDAAHEWNDQLVYISMSGCGHDGPWKDVISYAPTIHALCGLTHLTNPMGRGDVGIGFSLNDHAAGFAAAFSVLAGLEARNQTGEGQHIDMAQLEVGAYLMGPALIDHWATGASAQPMGNRDGLTDPVPNEVYRCGDDRFLGVTALDDGMWQRLRAVLEGDGFAVPGAHATIEERRAARGVIDETLGRWCAKRTGEEAMCYLQEAGVAAGVVQNAEDLHRHDEQLADRSFWLTAEHDGFGPRPHDRFPARWSEATLEPYRPAPAYLGEANFDVWTDLAGLDFDEVAEGIASGLFV